MFGWSKKNIGIAVFGAHEVNPYYLRYLEIEAEKSLRPLRIENSIEVSKPSLFVPARISAEQNIYHTGRSDSYGHSHDNRVRWREPTWLRLRLTDSIQYQYEM